MRCLDCRAEFKQKELGSTGKQCPRCGHAIAAMPKEDGISDGKIAAIIKRISGEQSLPVYPEHVAYAMATESSAGVSKGCACSVVLVVGAVIAVATSAYWVVVVALIIGGVLYKKGFSFGTRSYDDHLKVAKKFGHINNAFEDPDPGTNELDETLGQHAKRVLVCSNARYTRYLHASKFPLENACPVLGPKLAELALYPGLKERLRSDPNLHIIVLTDYTPAGMAFRDALPEPLRARDDLHVVGLNEAFVEPVGKGARPITDFVAPGSDRSGLSGKGVELFAVQPLVMLGLMVAALETFALVAPAEAAYDAGGSRDSE